MKGVGKTHRRAVIGGVEIEVMRIGRVMINRKVAPTVDHMIELLGLLAEQRAKVAEFLMLCRDELGEKNDKGGDGGA